MTPKIDVDSVLARAFGLSDELEPFDGAPHKHGRHQLLYAVAGMMHLEVERAQWLVPPRRAAWIPAGCLHRVRARVPVALRTVYFDHGLVPRAPATSVFSVAPLAHEMILFAMRWGSQRDPDDSVASPFFAALAALIPQWASEATAFRLPTAQSPELARAMRFAVDNLAQCPDIEAASRAARLSVRTLTRRFALETQMTWRGFLHTVRMVKAMDMLGIERAMVSETAFAVGFASLASFTHAFVRFTRERPRWRSSDALQAARRRKVSEGRRASRSISTRCPISSSDHRARITSGRVPMRRCEAKADDHLKAFRIRYPAGLEKVFLVHGHIGIFLGDLRHRVRGDS